jgi:hypothetical protein
LFVIPVGSALLAGGAWWAQRAADSLVRDGLYFRTVHWIRLHERAIDREFDLAQLHDDQSHHDLIEALDKTVIPFWRGAGDRLSAIHLLIDSPNRASLKNLQNAIDARAAAFQLLDDGLQKDDPKVVATARLELKEIDQATKE